MAFITEYGLNKFIERLNNVSYIDYLSSTKHIVSCHVALDNRELLSRFDKDMENVSASTCFLGEEIAAEKIQRTIIKNQNKILNWLNDYSNGDILIVRCKFCKPIGRGFFKGSWHDWDDGAIYCSACQVVLYKTGNESMPFKFRTAHPILTKEEKEAYLNSK